MAEILAQLEGERIILRKLRLSDADDMCRNVNDKKVVRWTATIPHPYTHRHALQYIRKSQRLRRAKKGYVFGIVKHDGEFMGLVSLLRVNHEHQCGELGYWLGKKYWEKAYAAEAVRLILRFGFEQLKLNRIYAVSFERNIASRRVLERCGFELEGVMKEAVVRYRRRQNILNFALLKSDYPVKRNHNY